MNKNRVFSNLIWRFAERIGAKLISLVISLILARVLGPDVYGTLAIVLVITTILQVFVESGFGTALIQKKNADDLDFSSVFYFNVAICLLLYLLLFLCAPLISKIYGRPELTALIRAVGIVLIISGVKNVQQAYVSKNMLFKRFFFSTLGGTIIGGTAGVIMALNGCGIWSYVTQYLLTEGLSTAILWLTVKWRPKAEFSFERLKGLFSYGWKLLLASFLNVVSDQIRSLIIGLKYSSSDLSFYDKGRQFPNLITENVNTSIDSVLLPALSEQQTNIENVKTMTRRAVQLSSYIMWPLMIGMCVCARPFVQLVLGDAWLPCVPFIQIFCLYYALWPIHTANLNAIKSVGRSDIFLKLEILKKLLDLAVIAATMFIGVKAMAIGLLAEGIACQAINALPNSKLIGYKYIDQLKDILPSILASIALGLAAYAVRLLGLGNLLTLLLQVIIGFAVYIILSKAFKLESFSYVLSIVKGYLKK